MPLYSGIIVPVTGQFRPTQPQPNEGVMALFYTSRNNGVMAVISEADAKLYGMIKKSGGDPTKVGVRVFTFCDSDRFQDPKERMVFTGTGRLFSHLSTEHDFSENKAESGWDGFVPFSNQEHSVGWSDPSIDWQRWVTTAEDFISKFEFVKQ